MENVWTDNRSNRCRIIGGVYHIRPFFFIYPRLQFYADISESMYVITSLDVFFSVLFLLSRERTIINILLHLNTFNYNYIFFFFFCAVRCFFSDLAFRNQCTSNRTVIK